MDMKIGLSRQGKDMGWRLGKVLESNRQEVDCVSNVMAHAQKPDFVFRRNGRVHLNRRGRQFGWLWAAEVCALAVVMLDTPCSEVMWRVLATHSIRQFPLQFPPRASTCAIMYQTHSTNLELIQYGIRRVIWLQTPTGLWLGGGSSSIYMVLVMLGRQKYTQQNH